MKEFSSVFLVERSSASLLYSFNETVKARIALL
nr:MAG TPA: hypothetical protein [Caudoviricetes sp.]DAW40327.1 MAG TPA: hypothetical protein [Caudoviricetes sp.]